MKTILIHNAKIINEGKSFKGSVLIKDKIIDKIFKEEVPEKILTESEVIDADGKWLIPGGIDAHVHFREPGLTEKATIASESKAAVAGGITSFFDMPNCIPTTTSLAEIKKKNNIAAQDSVANYSFYFGATSTNIDELKNINPSSICGIKLFRGASTGNMAIADESVVKRFFAEATMPIAVHCEENNIIDQNVVLAKAKFGDDIPVAQHSIIRSEEACYVSTAKTIELAQKHNTQLHVLHISTEKELSLFDGSKDVAQKRITAETCPQYLQFNFNDYETLKGLIKCNPAVKMKKDQLAIQNALAQNFIDTIGSDHAPHLLAEKEGNALTAKSGMPTMQFSVVSTFDLVKKGLLSREKAVEKLSHNPATIFHVKKRGFIRKGYFADLVLLNPDKQTVVSNEIVLSKCQWTPFAGRIFSTQIEKTFVNGTLVYDNGTITPDVKGEKIEFER